MRSLGDHPVRELADFAACKSLMELEDKFCEIVRSELDKIRPLLAGIDAFDLIEALRLRELPIVPVAALQPGFDGSAALIELMAIVLRSRGRKPISTPLTGNPTGEAVSTIHRIGMKLLRLSTYRLLVESRLYSTEPLAELAATYQSGIVNVRSMQYSSIHDRFNEELFGLPASDTILREILGFTYAEFLEVRGAVHDLYSERITAARDLLGEIAVEHHNGVSQSPERIEQGREALNDFMLLPGKRAEFRASDIAARTGSGTTLVEQVLGLFSLEFDITRQDTLDVRAFLRGDNPFQSRSLLLDGDGNYLAVDAKIGTDAFRGMVEANLKPTRHWKRYDDLRKTVSEKLTVEYLEAALHTKVAHTNLHYYSPRESHDSAMLNSQCTDPDSFGEDAEADGLFLVEDVAICVEVKARRVVDQARRGDVVRLSRELKAIVGTATSQAQRLSELVETNHGLWLPDRTWLDLSAVKEVRSIAVSFDDLGPLAIALDQLVSAGVVVNERLPWVVSLHDLAVVSAVVDRASELLLYLRRRTASDVAYLYRAVDELDLFMLFLEGELYVEPDPDEVHGSYVGTRKPSGHDRRLRAESAVPTMVGTHTDNLDAWMYHQEGSNSSIAPKPAFNCNAWVLELVDFLSADRKPGWFRFASDLLSLSGEAQERLAGRCKKLVKQTKSDHKPHTLFHSFAGVWGYPTLYLGTCPKQMPRKEAQETLTTYLIAKKHQLGSDRALGLLLDESGRIIGVRYDNRVPQANSALDELAEDVGLMPLEVMVRPVPPSAKRRTFRLRNVKSTGRRRK